MRIRTGVLAVEPAEPALLLQPELSVPKWRMCSQLPVLNELDIMRLWLAFSADRGSGSRYFSRYFNAGSPETGSKPLSAKPDILFELSLPTI
jgi:hypothetical protein